jgi:DNA ligase D-like protein (predicted 3'-phosphoesterase)
MPVIQSNLEKYNQKRDFEKTTEPKGRKRKEEPIFVVQEHNARKHHYDFRLAIDGVLKSWAIPRGMPKESQKHLAVQTEDHPMDYAQFEGKIPQGEYGGGTVKIEDKGTYYNIRKLSMAGALDAGQIEVHLMGDKLKGKFALINTKFNKDPKNWLIIKMKDDIHA